MTYGNMLSLSQIKNESIPASKYAFSKVNNFEVNKTKISNGVHFTGKSFLYLSKICVLLAVD